MGEYVVERMNRGCPKADGWWGGTVRPRGGGAPAKVKSAMPSGMAPLGLSEGCVVELDFGAVCHSDSWGTQHEVTGVRVVKAGPKAREALVRQLSSSDYRGIGPTAAAKVVDRFGMALEGALAMSDGDLAAECGISEMQACALRAGLSTAYAKAAVAGSMPSLSQRDVSMVAEALSRHGELVDELAAASGADAAGLVSRRPLPKLLPVLLEHPYMACLAGVPFEHADAVWLGDRKMPHDGAERVREGVLWALRRTLSGDMWQPTPGFERDSNRVSGMAGSTRLDLSDADMALALRDRASQMLGAFVSADVLWGVLGDLEQAGRVELSEAGGRMRVALSRTAMQERVLAAAVDGMSVNEVCSKRRAKALARHWPQLRPSQARAFVGALSSGVSVIAGGPGRGKTFVAAALAEAVMRETGSSRTVVGLAPTGKAAARMRELMAGTVPPSATTTCAHFNVVGGGDLVPRGGIAIVDEASMLDVETASKMFSILSKASCAAVLLGDVRQLPSVGAGDVLADIVESGAVPVFELDENMRALAGSAVARHCDDLAAGRVSSALASEPGFEVHLADSAVETAEWAVSRYLSLWGNGVPASDIGLLCAKANWDKATPDPTSAASLSQRVRDAVNPLAGVPSSLEWDPSRFANYVGERGCPVPGSGKVELRIGDRVLCKENNRDYSKGLHEDGDYDRDELASAGPLVNGDVGELVRYYPDAEECVVRFDDGSWCAVPLKLLRESFLPGWAMTVHKSQGSEYEHVIASMPQSGRSSFLTRNLLYTAVTRSSGDVALAGGAMQLLAMAAQGRLRRDTSLCGRLKEPGQTPCVPWNPLVQ